MRLFLKTEVPGLQNVDFYSGASTAACTALLRNAIYTLSIEWRIRWFIKLRKYVKIQVRWSSCAPRRVPVRNLLAESAHEFPHLFPFSAWSKFPNRKCRGTENYWDVLRLTFFVIDQIFFKWPSWVYLAIINIQQENTNDCKDASRALKELEDYRVDALEKIKSIGSWCLKI